MTSGNLFSTSLPLPEGKIYTSDASTTFTNEEFLGETEEEHRNAGKAVNNLAAILVPVFFSLIFVVGVTGNALVITVLVKMRKRQPNGLNITYCYILNLAIADSLFLFLCVPFQATVYTLPSWPFGEVVCHGSEFFLKTTMLASVYTMAALSFDRFYAIVLAKSSSQGRTNKVWAYLVLILIWIMALVFGILSIFTRKYIVYNGVPICMLNFEMPNFYLTMVVVIFVLGYVAPLLVIFACYVGVLIAMARNAQTSAARQNKSTLVMKKHVTKVVIMVVIFFALDWFLHHMVTLWIEFGEFPFTSGTLALKIIAHCLSYANSSVNPLIYAFVSNQFRKDFKNICPCRKVSRVIVNARKRSQNFAAAVHQHFQPKDSNESFVLQQRDANRLFSNVMKEKLTEEMNDSGSSSSATAMTHLTPNLGADETNKPLQKMILITKQGSFCNKEEDRNSKAQPSDEDTGLYRKSETCSIDFEKSSFLAQHHSGFGNHLALESHESNNLLTSYFDHSQSCSFATVQKQEPPRQTVLYCDIRKEQSEPIIRLENNDNFFL